MYLRGVTFIYLAKGTVSEGTNQARDLLSSLNSFPSYYRLCNPKDKAKKEKEVNLCISSVK